MDSDLKCNRLTCRKPLSDKAVVTTCSHIFCVECANELFTEARLCPACEALLNEPDDVVVCSLHPSNDYKTSVLSGLTPTIILEICSRAMSFWQYQSYQESSFQQAVVRKLTDQNNQSQKQLDSVLREANNEIALLNSKVTELQKDLEMERRKVRDLQEGSRDRDREYQKLKTQHDKMKRKALLGGLPGTANSGGGDELHRSSSFDESRQRAAFTGGGNMLQGGAGGGLHRGEPMDLGAVVGGMEASGIQRTPLVNRAGNNQWPPQGQRRPPQQMQQRHSAPLGYRSGNASDSSHGSAREVETMLGGVGSGRQQHPQRLSSGGSGGGWVPQPARMPAQGQGQRVFPSNGAKRSGTFRPTVR
ncbi:hypothetical protein CYLTODRAFT_416794 [Cylindrobasidium torrendii FP15055 ss-10]|uniref:RING-type domain-containing protein n=1 Tax=Cylindrobasidium torrendii FP15055 ss-10 TaxID=1314674 RepID=A0A0D7BVY3_9AGAR|nr:hypothetical protein CYLTODRAFT_416794 [Cylindrobasidium torrendii FP15055 ss-10]